MLYHIEVAVVDGFGKLLLNQKIRPAKPIVSYLLRIMIMLMMIIMIIVIIIIIITISNERSLGEDV